MNLDKNYRLISDDYNFILQKRIPARKARTERSKEWKNVGYWKDISQALRAYSRHFLRRKMPSSFDELLALERALSRRIEAIGERCVSLWGKN